MVQVQLKQVTKRQWVTQTQGLRRNRSQTPFLVAKHEPLKLSALERPMLEVFGNTLHCLPTEHTPLVHNCTTVSTAGTLSLPGLSAFLLGALTLSAKHAENREEFFCY